MNTLKLSIVVTFSLFLSMNIKAQTISWYGADSAKKQYISVNAGLEYGLVFGAGYHYRIVGKPFPLLLYTDYSMPSGANLTDDFKMRLGAHIRWVNFHYIHFSTGIYGVFRRYQNDIVRIVNFGSDMNATLGYYRKKWFIAAETGFDKAISSNFRHSRAYRELFPTVQDGWYEPATGGNFYYGFQGGVTFGSNQVYIHAGKVLTQDFSTAPLVPFYGKIGYNYNF